MSNHDHSLLPNKLLTRDSIQSNSELRKTLPQLGSDLAQPKRKRCLGLTTQFEGGCVGRPSKQYPYLRSYLKLGACWVLESAKPIYCASLQLLSSVKCRPRADLADLHLDW